jgi:hypothetical protein
MTVMQGDFPTNPPKISRTFVVHGTGALKGVKTIETDTMVGPPLTVVRTGQVMKWPSLS